MRTPLIGAAIAVALASGAGAQDASVEQPREPLRKVDIADPDAPPIEDATNVVPAQDGEVPGLGAETEAVSPSHTAATPAEPDVADRPYAAPEDFVIADMATMDPKQLLGVGVYSGDDERIGEVDRWTGETPGSRPEAAVVDVGGFLGLGAREIAIGMDDLVLMTDADGNDLRVYVEMTEREIEALPEIEG